MSPDDAGGNAAKAALACISSRDAAWQSARNCSASSSSEHGTQITSYPVRSRRCSTGTGMNQRPGTPGHSTGSAWSAHARVQRAKPRCTIRGCSMSEASQSPFFLGPERTPPSGSQDNMNSPAARSLLRTLSSAACSCWNCLVVMLPRAMKSDRHPPRVSIGRGRLRIEG